MDAALQPSTARVADIIVRAKQPRTKFNNLTGLAATIQSNGIIQPLVVRPHPTEHGKWELITGERRLRAARLAELEVVPVYNRTDIPDSKIYFTQILENLDDYRDPLDALEKSTALQCEVDERGVDVLCAELGVKKDWISRNTALARVSADVWQYANEKELGDKRTILDLDRLCKHTGRTVEEEMATIKDIGTNIRDALHQRMEAAGAKQRREKKDKAAEEASPSAPQPGAGAAGNGVSQSIQLRPSTDMTAPVSPSRFRRQGLAAKIVKAGSLLGIDPESNFEQLLDELVKRALPELQADLVAAG